jgi:hypothetical protein
MIYLCRVTPTAIYIAACEDEKDVDRVSRLVTRGYKMITRDEYMREWRAKDRRAAFGILATPVVELQERAIGTILDVH